MLQSILSTLKAFLSTVIAKMVAFGLILALLYGGYLYLTHRHAAELAASNKKADDAFLAQVQSEANAAAVTATLIKDREVHAAKSAALQREVDRLKKAGGRVVAVSDTSISVEDTSKAIPDQKGGTDAPKSWSDEYHRFHLDIASGLFKRSQLFMLEQRFVRSPSGEYEVVAAALHEYDPTTKAEIPTEGVKIGGTFQVVEEKSAVPAGPGPWHLRVVAGIDYRAAVGAGIGVTPTRHMSLSLIGLYKPTDKEFRAVLHGGYRLLNTTIAVGPYIGVSSKGQLVGGAAATLELTR